MGLFPSLKVSLEKPHLEVVDEVKNLMRKSPKPKDGEMPKFWSHKERLFVGIILAITVLGSVFFWYKGQDKMPEFNLSAPSFNFGGFGLNQTITVE